MKRTKAKPKIRKRRLFVDTDPLLDGEAGLNEIPEAVEDDSQPKKGKRRKYAKRK